MPFIPHTDDDVRSMLAAIGAPDIEALFDEVPSDLRCGKLEALPDGISEMEITRLMHQRADQDRSGLCFIGAGAYEHHVPAAVWESTTRGEFYSAYTPYQAEASQGTLQLIYEYQTMMAGLTAMDVSNASLYDGASALAEAVLMAVRAQPAVQVAAYPHAAHRASPYRKVARAIVHNQGIELVEVDYDRTTGVTNPASLEPFAGDDVARW